MAVGSSEQRIGEQASVIVSPGLWVQDCTNQASQLLGPPGRTLKDTQQTIAETKLILFEMDTLTYPNSIALTIKDIPGSDFTLTK